MPLLTRHDTVRATRIAANSNYLPSDQPDLCGGYDNRANLTTAPNGGSMHEVLFLGGWFWVGGVCADVCDPAVDECQETVEAAGGQLAERDFRPQAGQVPF